MQVKSPRLAAVPGFFMIMGLGHLYTRRWIKGVGLLTAGFPLALFAYAAVAVVASRLTDAVAVAASLITLTIVWVPFLAVLSWSA